MQNRSTENWISHTALITLLMSARVSLGMAGDKMKELWVSTPIGKFHPAICAKAGLNQHEYMSSKLPYVYAIPGAELLEVLGRRGIYGNEGDLGNKYYVQVIENRHVYVKYQQIIGSWKIGELSEAEYTAFEDAMAERLKEIATTGK
ncbi:hypothetical protein [Comamonas thiooxydans]|uniref:hypothetical protein n=1 Tax=Comamonas thiooxydans TaxID=363952 RepID=UPI00118564D9|nr:hypothetical protein [Comamonas thiooxydans]